VAGSAGSRGLAGNFRFDPEEFKRVEAFVARERLERAAVGRQ
jgi:hypothetical protein